MPDGIKRRGSLYCGPDLVNAADRSDTDRYMRDRYAGILNSLGVFADTVRHRRQQSDNPQFELVVATGQIRGTSSTASVAYAGNGVNRDWCVGTAISGQAEIKTRSFLSAREARDELRKTIEEVDIVFVDDIGENLMAKLPADFVCIPAWIKQRLRLADDWTSQVRSLKRGTRQEISRILRKYGYKCELTSNAADVSRFYDEQYRPHVSSMYGKSAIIVGRERFIRECRRGVLLQLLRHGTIIATALLRPIGRTMAIVWTGVDPSVSEKRIPGATDALDYFSLLHAHLKGYRWLDFGPSRADLYDGTLRYKRKWGAEIIAGVFKQPSIYLTCNGRNDAVYEFLRRHAFISNKKGNLTALVFLDDKGSTETPLSRVEKLITPGISDYQVISLRGPLQTDLQHGHPNISTTEAMSVADAMRIAS